MESRNNGTLHLTQYRTSVAVSSFSYSVMWQSAAGDGVASKTSVISGPNQLVELLDRLHVEWSQPGVRQAIEELLTWGSASIAGVWLSDEEIRQAGLA